MTLELFTSFLEEIVGEKDRVSIPGLGIFTASLQPASISDNGFTINPPYRKIDFDFEESDDTSDQSIVQLYAVRYGVDKEVASREIDESVREIRKSLNSDQVCELPGLGKFHIMSDGLVFFIVDKEAQLYPDGFGLESVSFKNRPVASLDVPVVSTPIQAEVEEVIEKEEVPLYPKKKKSKWWKVLLWLVCALFVMLGGFMLLAHFCPELIDKVLYTPEELDILNSVGL